MHYILCASGDRIWNAFPDVIESDETFELVEYYPNENVIATMSVVAFLIS